MSSANLETTISNAVLPHLHGVTDHEKWLNCASEYPWYPLPFLMLSIEPGSDMVQKTNLWFNDHNRLHWLLNKQQVIIDPWLQEQLNLQIENNHQNVEIEEVVNADDIKVSDESILLDVENKPISGKEGTEDAFSPINGGENSEPAKNFDNQAVAEPNSDKKLNDTSEPGSKELDTLVSGAAEPAVALSRVEQDKKEQMVFEPYHSVDYFASMGIKVDLNEVPKDGFERQLKSFTQWLKTMKKVTIPEAAAADPIVEAQANQSNVNKEIITEAMAQVLLKQGKHQKALEIYQKLILLHPEKSVFFAAQIEQLKNIR